MSVSEVDLELGGALLARRGALMSAGAALAAQTKVALLGTSISAQNTNYPAGGIQNLGRGYFTWAQILSGQRLAYDPANNYGVASDTIALAAVRVPAIIASGCKVCIVEVGANDPPGGRTVAQMRSDMTTLILQPLMRAGITPIVCTIAPRSGMTVAQNAAWAGFNAWLRDLSFGRSDLLAASGLPHPPVICDVVDSLEDKASAGLSPISTYTRDGTHPTGLGAFHWGRALASVISVLFPARPTTSVSAFDIYDATNNPAGNKTTRGALLGTGGSATTSGGLTPTGAVATGWAVQRGTGTSAATLTASKENPRTDGPNSGERQILAVTSPGGGLTSELYVMQLQANIGVTAGQQFYAECTYEILGNPVGFVGAQLHLFTGGGGVGQYVDDGAPDTANVAAVPVAHRGVLRTPILTVATGNTAMNINPGVAIKADTAANVVIAFGDVMIRPVVA